MLKERNGHETMIALFQELFSDVNLPATVLMIGVLLYWLMVIVGVFGLDTIDMGDADVDFGLDADVDLDLDVGLDADIGDLDINTGVDGAPATTVGGSTATGNEGFLKQLFEYFYLGEIPIVIVASTLVFFLWILTYTTNHYFNADKSMLVAAGWFLPNLLISLLATRYAMIPFSIIFRKAPPEDKTREKLLGLIGVVKTSEVTEKFGQIELKIKNEPEMILNVRTKAGEKLAKGDAAKLVQFDPENGTFLVELTKWEKKNDG